MELGIFFLLHTFKKTQYLEGPSGLEFVFNVL